MPYRDATLTRLLRPALAGTCRTQMLACVSPAAADADGPPAYFTPDAMPLHKVTIVAKGGSGGHTAFIPPENAEWHQTKAQLKARMDTSMGGRAAERLAVAPGGTRLLRWCRREPVPPSI